MADYNSSLPVRTETNGDVAVKIVDGTIVSQALLVNPDGSINVNTGASDANVNLHDGSGVAITSVVNGSQTALSTIDQADGPVAPGTAASFSQLAGGVYHTAPPTLTNGQQAALQVDSAGRLLVDAAVTFPYDTNYGTVDATTLRTASQIGNATGAADFNAGATGAQTLRTTSNQGTPNTIANAWPVTITDGANTLALTGGAIHVDVTVALPAGSNTIGAVTQAGGPWTVTLPYDENWGAVGATTLRTAAEIGNAAGAADFNFGTVGAQTLRVASQIGNATGAADFNAGATSAQTLRVAANLYSAAGTAFSVTNPLPVTIDTVPGTAVADYKDAPSIAQNASDTHTYTVPGGETFYFDEVIASGSGAAKMLVAVNGVTKFVQFNSTATPNMNFTLPSPIAVATGTTVTVVMTNLDKGAQDLYSTICGNLLP